MPNNISTPPSSSSSQGFMLPEEMAHDFRQAIIDHKLTLNYQPIVNLSTGMILGFETLMRWNHPQRGPISPAIFIPMAEETGLIVDASKWALKEAIQGLKRLESHVGHNERIYMSVNFSPNDLASDSFLDELYHVISASDVRPTQIQLEITADLLGKQPERAIKTLDICKKTGLKIAIDDYGLGEPEDFFPQMDTLPISTVKIDYLVIKNIVNVSEASDLVVQIIAAAKERQIDVIAEGIERQEEALMLQEMGCSAGQGYYFTKPLPERELTSLLLNYTGFSDLLK